MYHTIRDFRSYTSTNDKEPQWSIYFLACSAVLDIDLDTFALRIPVWNFREQVLLWQLRIQGRGQGGHDPPVPVKTSHKKDGRHPRCLIFYVSCPPPPNPTPTPLWQSWIRCCVKWVENDIRLKQTICAMGMVFQSNIYFPLSVYMSLCPVCILFHPFVFSLCLSLCPLYNCIYYFLLVCPFSVFPYLHIPHLTA